MHSSVQIEGDTGRLVNRHRCTELSRTESGRKRKVTLSQWEGSNKVNNTCCVTKATVKKKKRRVVTVRRRVFSAVLVELLFLSK